MRSHELCGSLALVLVAVSCASPRAHSPSADAVGSATDSVLRISLERGSCRGSCPSYTVSLGHDGLVRFTGIRSVRPIGADSSRVPAASVTALQTAFASRQFARVPSTIEYGTPSCGAYIADLPTHVLTVRSESGEHRVRYDEGCRDHPMMLDTLAQMVDSVSGAARWFLSPTR